ncbi:MAG: glycosyltransferase family 4 protein [Planctomycetota bacterium]
MAEPSPPSVTIVTERYAAWGGGHERSTSQIVAELCRRGHAVTVLTGVGPDLRSGREGERGEHGERIRSMGLRRLGGAIDVVRFVRWADRQVVEVGSDVSLSMTTAASADLVQPRGGTVIETMTRNRAIRRTAAARLLKRTTQALLPKQRALVWAERRTLGHPRLKRALAVSGYVARQLAEHHELDGDRVVTIPNAAVVPAIDDAERASLRRRVRAAWGVDEQAVAYLFAATNPRLKGLGTLIDATRELKRRDDRPWSVWLVGSSSYSVYDAVRRAGVDDRVCVMGPTHEIDALYAAADVVVLPTHYDPASKVIIEGLMAGLPGITTAYNGAADFLLPSPPAPPRGVVIDDPSDAAALTDAMAAMLDDEQRGAFADAIGDGLAEELSMARHVDRLVEVLDEVVAERRSASDAQSRST